MIRDDWVSHWIPACENLFGKGHSFEWNKQLDDALGIDELQSVWGNDESPRFKPMTEELKKLLELLAGPHGKTLLKAYRIRKGLEP